MMGCSDFTKSGEWVGLKSLRVTSRVQLNLQLGTCTKRSFNQRTRYGNDGTSEVHCDDASDDDGWGLHEGRRLGHFHAQDL